MVWACPSLMELLWLLTGMERVSAASKTMRHDGRPRSRESSLIRTLPLLVMRTPNER